MHYIRTNLFFMATTKTKKKSTRVNKVKSHKPSPKKVLGKLIKQVRAETTNEKRILHIQPGAAGFQDFLQRNADLFNLTEIERLAGLPNGTLRHIRTGNRVATFSVYEKVREKVLPKLCEGAFILQNYTGNILQQEITF